MSRRLTASGVLYTSGYKVGTSGYTIADNQLRNGIISAIALGKDCLGGLIDKFGWEDKDKDDG